MPQVQCSNCRTLLEAPPNAPQVRCYKCQHIVDVKVQVTCYNCRQIVEGPPGVHELACWNCHAINATGPPPPPQSLPLNATVLLTSIACGGNLQVCGDQDHLDIDGKGQAGPRSQFVVQRHDMGGIRLGSVSHPDLFVAVHGETGDLFPGRGGKWSAFNVIELGGNVVALQSVVNQRASVGVTNTGLEVNALRVKDNQGHFRVSVIKPPLPSVQQPQFVPPPQLQHAPPPGRFQFQAPQGAYAVEGLGSGGPRALSVPTGDPNNPTALVSSCTGQKKAVFIGINYFGSSAELRGCINDVHNIKRFMFERFGFTEGNSLTLTDDQHDPRRVPTKQNIYGAFQYLVSGARPGDSLFLHYSGHGGSETDKDGDEVDGKDETIIPVDYKSAGQITDDEINRLVVQQVPPGVRLTAIFDSCHSGSVMDLPYTYKINGQLEVQEVDNRKLAMQAGMAAASAYMRGNTVLAMQQGMAALGHLFGGGGGGKSDSARAKTEQTKGANADIIQFSGCRDEQTSADAVIGGSATGAMSFAFKKALEEHPNMTYLQLLGTLREILAGKYSQVPQMSSSRRMNLAIPFWM